MKIRIKRPKGITYQIKNLKTINNQEEFKKERERIINRIINEYINDGFRLNNKPTNLNQLSEYIGESLIQCMKRMNRLGEHLLGNDKNNGFRVLLANTINHLTTTKALVLGQFNTLNASQSDGYVPFISSAVNEVLRGLVSTDSNFISLLKVMAPAQHPSVPSTIINNNPIGQALTNNNLLNVNEAIKLIDKQREVPLLESQNKIDNLEQTYIEPGTPQILATKQQGTNNDGLVRPKKKLRVHELRREDQDEIINPEI